MEERPAKRDLRIDPTGLEAIGAAFQASRIVSLKVFISISLKWSAPQVRRSSSDLPAGAFRRRQERSSNHAMGVMLIERSDHVNYNGGDLMKDRSEKSRGQPRKPYSKPEVRQIPLRPEEAVLGGCKSGASSGPVQATCNFVGNCAIIAS